MRRTQRIKIRLAAVLALSLTPAAWAGGDLRTAELGDCPLENGGVILDCRLAYRTIGALNADRSNVIIFPSWYTGATQELLDNGYIGPGRIADTERYYVIAMDAFGNGVSSSPSNSTKQAGAAFPLFTVRDMVRAQQRLLTEHLAIDHVHAVIGVSMGGMQAFEWAATYPRFMDYVVPIEGTPWLSPYNLMLWHAEVDAIDGAAGDADSLSRSIRLLAALDGLTLWSPQHFNGMVKREGFDRFMQEFSSGITADSLLNRRSQAMAMIQHDISLPFAEFNAHARDIITARTLVVVFDTDHMVTPEPALELAQRIGAETLNVKTSCGHMGATAECNQAEVAAAVNAFINPARE